MLLRSFDNKRIVSGAYDGKIKVWDLRAALDVRTPHQDLCLRTLVVSIYHTHHLHYDTQPLRLLTQSVLCSPQYLHIYNKYTKL